MDVGDGRVREEVIERLAGVGDGPQEISRAVDQLLHRGWLTRRRRSPLGPARSRVATAKARIQQLVTGLRAEIHDGIPDEDYVTALKVLRRMTDNIGQAGRPRPRPVTVCPPSPPVDGAGRVPTRRR